MSATTGDSIATYGHPMVNYSPPVDATRDLDAACGNKQAAATSGMTNTAVRAWVRMTLATGGVGTATPVLVAQSQLWTPGVSPVLAYAGTTGTFTVTWPATVSDEIVIGMPGYTGPVALNLRAGWANLRAVATPFDLFVNLTSANVAQLLVFNVAGALANPAAAVDVDVFVL